MSRRRPRQRDQPPVLRSSAAARADEAREKRSWGCAFMSLLLLVAIVGLVVGILASDLFAVQEVRVVCADESLRVEAAGRARDLEFGTIWLPPTLTIERRIGGLPRARSVRIDRALPATVVIMVEPRQPFAMVKQGNRFMTVDRDGVCLHWTGQVPDGMPRIHIEDPSSMAVGRTLSERDIRLINDIMSGLTETGLEESASLDISHPIRITVFTEQGVLGKLGNQELLYEKTLLFGKLLHALSEDGEKPLYIDLRVPSRPTCMK